MMEEDAVSIGAVSICSTISNHSTASRAPHTSAHALKGSSMPSFVAPAATSSLTTEGVKVILAETPIPEEHSHTDTMFECAVCMEEREIANRCDSLSCACTCCRSCVRTHFTLRIRDGNVLTLPCPGCAAEVQPSRLRALLQPSTFQRYMALTTMEAQNKRVREDPDLTWCPTPDCATVVSRTKHGSGHGSGKNVTCPSCCKGFCFECHGPAHKASRSCEEARKKLGKKDEDAFHKWAKGATKPCPECRTLIERNKQEGSQDCNHMTCSKCKTEFCWLCGRKVPPLGHFDITNVLGCPGLQYSGPDVKFSGRLAAKSRALRIQTTSGAKTTAKVVGYGILVILAAPFVAVSALPVATYKGIMKCKGK